VAAAPEPRIPIPNRFVLACDMSRPSQVIGSSVTNAELVNLACMCAACPKIEGLGHAEAERLRGQQEAFLYHVSSAKEKMTSWNFDAGEHDQKSVPPCRMWKRE